MSYIVSNVFYIKLMKNGKIILTAGEGRGTSSSELACYRKLIEYLQSPSR